MEGKTSNCIKIGKLNEAGLTKVSVSRIKAWRKCQQAHDWKYVNKLRRKSKSRPLTIGGWIHSCLEAMDKGDNWIDVLRELKRREYDSLFAEEKAELGDIPTDVMRLMRAYEREYANTRPYKIIALEQEFLIRMPGTTFVLHGIFDKIAIDEFGMVWVVEHKTHKRFPDEEQRQTDVQTAVYLWVLSKIADILGIEQNKVGGVLFDYICTKPPTTPQLLKDGSMSKRKIHCDPYTYMVELKKHNLNAKDYSDFIHNLKENEFFRRVQVTRSASSISNIMREILTTCLQIQHLSGKNVAKLLGYGCNVPKCEYRELCFTQLENGDLETIIKLLYDREEKDNDRETDELDSTES
jgi:hypothetical protein